MVVDVGKGRQREREGGADPPRAAPGRSGRRLRSGPRSRPRRRSPSSRRPDAPRRLRPWPRRPGGRRRRTARRRPRGRPGGGGRPDAVELAPGVAAVAGLDVEGADVRAASPGDDLREAAAVDFETYQIHIPWLSNGVLALPPVPLPPVPAPLLEAIAGGTSAQRAPIAIRAIANARQRPGAGADVVGITLIETRSRRRGCGGVGANPGCRLPVPAPSMPDGLGLAPASADSSALYRPNG